MTGTPQEPRGADWTAPGVTVDKVQGRASGPGVKPGLNPTSAL